MARKLRVQYADALYHTMNRGLDRRALFLNERDYAAFLEDLEASVEQYGVLLHAYALLANHFHLLVQTPQANLSAFMQALQTRYAVYFNLRHGKRGHVFQGPYRALLVDEHEYLLRLSRYIHLNPVRTRAHKGKPTGEVIQALRTYKWSSYRGYIRRVKRTDWVRYTLLERQVRARFGQQKGAYRKYVESGLAETDEAFHAALRGGTLAIGAAEFVEEIGEQYRQLREEGRRRPEDVSLRNERRPVPVEEILVRVCRGLGIGKTELLQRRGGGFYRGVAAKMLVKYGGLSQREAATHLKVGTGAAVSIRIREAEAVIAGSGSWQKKMARLERQLATPL